MSTRVAFEEQRIPAWKRAVLKVGSSLLAGEGGLTPRHAAHLAAFVATQCNAGTRLLTLDTTASGLALARTGATRHALLLFGGAGIVAQFIQFHVAYSLAGRSLPATDGDNTAFLR